MTTQVQVAAKANSGTGVSPYLVLAAGWLVPGAGHFLLKKPIRGGLILVSVVGMFVTGIALEGKIYTPNTGDLLDILGFVGQFGSGVLYMLSRMLGWGHDSVQIAVADYGTKFLVVAGLLNIIAAVDAHSLSTGRKAS
ncbi:hypothetical protein SAMN05421771_3871 [Granulicella pectinivorans]|jgi:hypothetical protein|uniref:DUF6677 domain-containing protein n=1 Tax=Granulicella pectinivorans TaxID=474950 RepID=A0A1I6MZ35_9BACT|nr:DUF6677 family protein [Granulicella pectinivorans]SFS20828.1 hypothetical protein SAMN05421771_3871 [Granulicella pectinivorans]